MCIFVAQELGLIDKVKYLCKNLEDKGGRRLTIERTYFQELTAYLFCSPVVALFFVFLD